MIGKPYLIIYEYLHWVIPPLNQHQLVRLAGHGVGEWGAHPRRRVWFDPHADGESVHLW